MEVLVHSRIGGTESIQAVLLWASNACSIRLAFASELDGRYGSSHSLWQWESGGWWRVDTLRSARFGIGKAEGGGGSIRFVALALAMGKRRVVEGRYAS